jgi:hypothetical protein
MSTRNRFSTYAIDILKILSFHPTRKAERGVHSQITEMVKPVVSGRKSEPQNPGAAEQQRETVGWAVPAEQRAAEITL